MHAGWRCKTSKSVNMQLTAWNDSKNKSIHTFDDERAEQQESKKMKEPFDWVPYCYLSDIIDWLMLFLFYISWAQVDGINLILVEGQRLIYNIRYDYFVDYFWHWEYRERPMSNPFFIEMQCRVDTNWISFFYKNID